MAGILKIYFLEGCPYCEGAVKLLDSMHVNYKIVEVTQKNNNKVKKKLGRDTFPQLVLGDLKLGGYDELEKIVAVCKLLNKTHIDPRAVDYICRKGRT